MATLSLQERQKILKELKPQSKVTYIGNESGPLKPGMTGFKVRSLFKNSMTVVINGSYWNIGYSLLTCEKIKIAEELLKLT